MRSQLLKVLGIVGGVVLVLGFILHFVVFPAMVKSTGNQHQNALMQSYSNAAGKLHDCKAQGAQAASTALALTDAQERVLDNVLTDAVGGRMGEGDINQGTFVAAMRTAVPVSLYPDTAELSRTFQQVLAKVTGCQGEFLFAQREVQGDVKRFRDFRTASWFSRTYGSEDYPTNELVIILPGVPMVSGQQALMQIATPIIDSKTSDAYSTGLDDGALEGPFTQAPASQPPAAPGTR